MRSGFCVSVVGLGLAAAGGAVSAIGQDIVFEGGVVEGPLELSGSETLTLIGPVQAVPGGTSFPGSFGISPFVVALGDSQLTIDGPVNGFDDNQFHSYAAVGGSRIELRNTAADIVIVQQDASGFIGPGTAVPRVQISDNAVVEISGTSLRNPFTSSLTSSTVQITDSAQVVVTDSAIVSENGPGVEGRVASEIVVRDSEVSSLTLLDDATAAFTNVQLGGGSAEPALQSDSFGISSFTGGSIAAQDINGVAVDVTARGQVQLREGVEVVGTTAVREIGLLRVDEGADLRAGQTPLEVSGNGIVDLTGGRFTALSPDAPVVLRADEASIVDIEGGMFFTEAQGDPLPQLVAAGSSVIALVGDYSTFELDGALLPEADASGLFFVTSESGTLAGVLSNGDRFDLSFVRDASATLFFRGVEGQDPVGPSPAPGPAPAPSPAAVPSPSAAALGSLLAAGLLARRRRRA